MKTYHRFLIKHWSYNFLLTFCIINILLLIGNVVKFGSKVGFVTILPIIPTLLPAMLVYSLPMSSLISTITTLARARRHTEPITLASSGINLFQLTPPFLLAGLLLNILTLISFEWLQPMSETYNRNYLSNVAGTVLNNELSKPQGIIELKNLRIYTFVKKGIRSAIIQQREHGQIKAEVLAEAFDYKLFPEKKLVKVYLTNSKIISFENQLPQSISEDPNGTLSFEIPYEERSIVSKSNYRQMAPTEMWALLKKGDAERPLKLKTTFWEKISLLFSPLLLILAAFPIGFLGNSDSRVVGFFLGLGVAFLIYYPLMLAGKKMSMAGIEPSWLLMQIPNIGLLLIGMIGLTRLNRKI